MDWEDFRESPERPSNENPNPISGQWNVIFIANESDPAHTSMNGYVFLLPEGNAIWEKTVIQSLQAIHRDIYEKADVGKGIEDLKELLLNRNDIYTSKFKLTRSGLTFLQYMAVASRADKPDTPQIICRHAYYYVKYSFHKHKHHATAESLTSIYEYTGQEDVDGKALINGLKGALTRLHRDAHPADYKALFASKGIASYIKSLIISCRREGLISESVYSTELLYTSNITESLEIKGKKIESEIAVRSSFNVNFRSILIFIFGLLAPFVILFKDEILNTKADPSNHVIKAIRWFVANEFHIVATAVIVIFYYWLSKKIVLRWGSARLAAKKYHAISVAVVDFVAGNKRGANVLLYFGYAFLACLVLALLNKLFDFL